MLPTLVSYNPLFLVKTASVHNSHLLISILSPWPQREEDFLMDGKRAQAIAIADLRMILCSRPAGGQKSLFKQVECLPYISYSFLIIASTVLAFPPLVKQLAYSVHTQNSLTFPPPPPHS